MRIDIDRLAETLTLGDMEFLERESGLTMDDLAAGRLQVAGILALITIEQRRTNPDFTMDDARAIPVSELEIVTADPQTPKRRAKAAS